jgi:hypothetical protein
LILDDLRRRQVPKSVRFKAFDGFQKAAAFLEPLGLDLRN